MTQPNPDDLNLVCEIMCCRGPCLQGGMDCRALKAFDVPAKKILAALAKARAERLSQPEASRLVAMLRQMADVSMPPMELATSDLIAAADLLEALVDGETNRLIDAELAEIQKAVDDIEALVDRQGGRRGDGTTS